MRPILEAAFEGPIDVVRDRVDTRPSLWGLLPEDFAAIGCPGKPEHIFGRVQRVWAWPPRSSRI